MDVPQTDLMSLATSRLAWLDDRQHVLARNIANADTPGYTPRDEQPFDGLVQNAALGLDQDDPQDLPGTVDSGHTVMLRPNSRAIDGNAVALDQEMTKVADNDTQQRLVTNIYSKYMGMYQTALGKGS